jgi:hypothetical protein
VGGGGENGPWWSVVRGPYPGGSVVVQSVFRSVRIQGIVVSGIQVVGRSATWSAGPCGPGPRSANVRGLPSAVRRSAGRRTVVTCWVSAVRGPSVARVRRCPGNGLSGRSGNAGLRGTCLSRRSVRSGGPWWSGGPYPWVVRGGPYGPCPAVQVCAVRVRPRPGGPRSGGPVQYVWYKVQAVRAVQRSGPGSLQGPGGPAVRKVRGPCGPYRHP